MTGNDNKVSKHFPELFHYTTVLAFESIYKTKTFWATHFHDLNDSTELGRFRLKVFEFIHPKIREIFENRIKSYAVIATEVTERGGINIVVENEANMLLDTLHRDTFGKRTFGETFICSFCAHKDDYNTNHGLLSQWRGYGADGGVAIVLNTQRIEACMHHEREFFAHPINHIGDVVYDDNGDRIRKDFRDVFEHFPEILNIFYSDKEPCYEQNLETYFEKMFMHFVSGSTLVKHHAFHEENEVRIVVSPRPTDKDSIFYTPEHASKPSKDIRYKQKGTREARYIELFGDAPLPIKRVIVGPSRYQCAIRFFWTVNPVFTGQRIRF